MHTFRTIVPKSMGLIARQSFKAATVTYAGVALGVVNSLYIYTKMLTVDQLGEITFLHTTVAILAPLILFGLGSALVRFYPKVKEDFRAKDVLFTIVFSLVLLNVILFSSVALIFREQFFDWVTNEESFLLATSFALVGMACLQTFIYLSSSMASLNGRIAVPSMLVQVIKVVQPALIVLFYSNLLSFEMVVYGLLIYYIILALVYLKYSLSLNSFSISFDIQRLPFTLKSLLFFAFFSVLGSVGGALTNQIDVVMVTNILGKYETGLYGWSLFFITVIAIPYSLIATVATPLISQYWQDENYYELNKIYKQSSSTLFVISLGLFVSILAGIDELFTIMPKGDEYRLAKSLVVLLCIAKVIDLATGLNNQIIAMSKSYKILLVFLTMTVMSNIGLNILFIPIYGIEGSAFATIVSIVLYNGLKFMFLKLRYNLNPFSQKMITTLLLGLIVIVLTYLVPRLNFPWINILLFSGGSFVIYFLSVYVLRLAPELNDFVNKQFFRIGIKPFDKK